MDINNSTSANPINISSLVSSSISKLNINSIKKPQETEKHAQNNVKEEIETTLSDNTSEDLNPINSSKNKDSIDVNDIQKYAGFLGENLSIEDINYGLMYGRSVIVDYSA